MEVQNGCKKQKRKGQGLPGVPEPLHGHADPNPDEGESRNQQDGEKVFLRGVQLSKAAGMLKGVEIIPDVATKARIISNEKIKIEFDRHGTSPECSVGWRSSLPVPSPETTECHAHGCSSA